MPLRFSFGLAGSITKIQTQKNSFVSISVNGKTIYMASKKYSGGSPRVVQFYKDNKISANINLLDYNMAHGTAEDHPDNTLPKFYAAAKQIRQHLTEEGDCVLVNCEHGRSRTGSVVALYLILFENLSAEVAINIVNSALKKRGFSSGIDLKAGLYGSYGDWLKDLETSFSNKDDPKTYIKILLKSPNYNRTVAKRNEADASGLLEETSNIALEFLDEDSRSGPGL